MCGAVARFSDSGPGLEDPDRAFLPSYSTKSHGAGVGLAISRRIAELHGGQLVAAHGRRHGAELVLSLPAMSAASERVPMALDGARPQDDA